MKDLNKVIITGNLGHDPEMVFTSNGNALVRLNLGSHRKVRQSDGSYQEKTQWSRIVVWNQLAEIAAEYLSKGAKVMIEGRLETRQYQDSQGLTRWVTEVVATEMYLLGNSSGRTQLNGSEVETEDEAEEEETLHSLEVQLQSGEEEEEVAAQEPTTTSLPPLRLVTSEVAALTETSPLGGVVPEAKADPWSKAGGKSKVAARQIFEDEHGEEESLPLLAAPELISTEQLAKIEQVVKEKGYSFQAADGTAVKLFGVKVGELTQSQAEEMLSRLQRLKDKEKRAA